MLFKIRDTGNYSPKQNETKKKLREQQKIADAAAGFFVFILNRLNAIFDID